MSKVCKQDVLNLLNYLSKQNLEETKCVALLTQTILEFFYKQEISHENVKIYFENVLYRYYEGEMNRKNDGKS